MQRYDNAPLILMLILALAAFACGDDSSDDGSGMDSTGDETPDSGDGDDAMPDSGDGDEAGEIEIAGDWTGEFGDESIDSEMWNSSIVVEFDNDENYAITENAADAEWMPGKFNRLVWTEPEDDAFYYCTVDFDLDSAEDAAASTMDADAEDLEGAGCGGFSWTKLEAP